MAPQITAKVPSAPQIRRAKFKVSVFGPVSGEKLQECLKKDGLEGDIYRGCYALLKDNRDEIEKIFPKLNRFMTGYDLDHSYDPKTDTLNLARLICGAEGTDRKSVV